MHIRLLVYKGRSVREGVIELHRISSADSPRWMNLKVRKRSISIKYRLIPRENTLFMFWNIFVNGSQRLLTALWENSLVYVDIFLFWPRTVRCQQKSAHLLPTSAAFGETVRRKCVRACKIFF